MLLRFTDLQCRNKNSFYTTPLKSVEQYFGLAGWRTWQTGRSVETKEVLTFNSSFLNKSLTWSFLVVSSPKWGVRSLCGKGTKYYSSLSEHMGTVGICTAKINGDESPLSHFVPPGLQQYLVPLPRHLGLLTTKNNHVKILLEKSC